MDWKVVIPMGLLAMKEKSFNEIYSKCHRGPCRPLLVALSSIGRLHIHEPKGFVPIVSLMCFYFTIGQKSQPIRSKTSLSSSSSAFLLSEAGSTCLDRARVLSKNLFISDLTNQSVLHLTIW